MDWIALAALGLSTGSLGWQIVERARTRRRLIVSSTTGVARYASGGESGRAQTLAVTAHALHGSIGIRGIEFEFDRETLAEAATWSLWHPSGRPPAIDLEGDHAALEEGATATWQYLFYESGESGFSCPTTVTPTIVLVSGRRVRVPPVTLHPDVNLSSIRQALDRATAKFLAREPGELPDIDLLSAFHDLLDFYGDPPVPQP